MIEAIFLKLLNSKIFRFNTAALTMLAKLYIRP